MGKRAKPRVTVSLPYFDCRKYVRRAVESILGQSHRELMLIIVNDGDPDPPWEALSDITDSRIVRFDLATNHGRYFADSVVLAATTDQYFMFQDADDWSEATRIATLMEAVRRYHSSGAISAHYDY